jgi:hypothetical protein
MGFLTEDRTLFHRHDGGQSNTSTANGSDEDEREDRTGETNMGGAAVSRADLEANNVTAKTAHVAIKKTIPLYIGLATGFCGLFTSFSTFIRDVFLALSNEAPTIVSRDKSTSIIPEPEVSASWHYLLSSS